MRFVESFYSHRPYDSHILLLSPQVELSPFFFHYVFYNLLEYKYSSYTSSTYDSATLAGISLITPTLHVDGKTPFTLPELSLDGQPSAAATPFLWQVPETNAALYFGDKWRELHSFLSNRLSHTSPPIHRVLQPTAPSFAEPLLELMSVRGYSLLYPHFPAHTIATLQTTPFSPPEEFLSLAPSSHEAENLSSATPWYDPPNQPQPPPHIPPQLPLAMTPLHNLLPSAGDLPELSDLPHLNVLGYAMPAEERLGTTESLLSAFRTSIGSCPDTHVPDARPLLADDLFCSPEYDDWDSLGPVYRFLGRPGPGHGAGVAGHIDHLEEEISPEQQAAMRWEFGQHLERQRHGVDTEKVVAGERKERLKEEALEKKLLDEERRLQRTKESEARIEAARLQAEEDDRLEAESMEREFAKHLKRQKEVGGKSKAVVGEAGERAKKGKEVIGPDTREEAIGLPRVDEQTEAEPAIASTARTPSSKADPAPVPGLAVELVENGMPSTGGDEHDNVPRLTTKEDSGISKLGSAPALTPSNDGNYVDPQLEAHAKSEADLIRKLEGGV